LSGDEHVDGDIGNETIAATCGVDVPTFLRAQYGVHYAYLERLPSWPQFKGGWSHRLLAARDVALQLRGV
jgi:hypothetical protein